MSTLFAVAGGVLCAALYTPVYANTLAVGPGQQYLTIAAAVAASADGDTVAVQAGTYINDFAEIGTQISLIAVGGRVTMKAAGALLQDKAILITDTNVSITGFTFTGAKIPGYAGGNGAGIRYQGGNLTLTDCYVHHNQEGLLGAPDPTGTITILNSEFAHNGAAHGPSAGYTHNIYAGAIAQLDIENSWIHDANVGHEIKSRALATIVNNTRVTDGPTGTASYSIDLPNGGVAMITNDQIEQGPLSQNPIVISFGEEGGLISNSSLTVSNTLIENDLALPMSLGLANDAGITAMLTGLNIYGLTPDQLYTGAANLAGITYLSTEPAIGTQHPWQ